MVAVWNRVQESGVRSLVSARMALPAGKRSVRAASAACRTTVAVGVASAAWLIP